MLSANESPGCRVWRTSAFFLAASSCRPCPGCLCIQHVPGRFLRIFEQLIPGRSALHRRTGPEVFAGDSQPLLQVRNFRGVTGRLSLVLVVPSAKLTAALHRMPSGHCLLHLSQVNAQNLSHRVPTMPSCLAMSKMRSVIQFIAFCHA